MSNKSGNAEQVISLPKGGGDLTGMGETFSPDLHTGTGNFSVPIALPSGRNGFQPSLNLVYSTGNGNSCFGQGWQLNIPGVSRKTAKGIPNYQGEDTFLLSGVEDLIPVEQGDNFIRYQPRTEGLFALIRRFREPARDYWEVKTKDGLVSYYGSPETERNDSAVLYNPELASHIFNWNLSETHDPFGNRIVYEYDRDLGPEERPFHQLYLQSIRYLDYLDSDGNEQFLVRVEFEYDEDRPDPFSVYTSGFEIRTRKRCRRILVKTFPEGVETLLRTYDLTYETATLSKVSLLKSVQLVGHDGDISESLPPLFFGYATFEPKARDFQPVQGHALPPQSLASPDTEMVDLFGNGLPDIVQMNGTIRYWKNLGDRGFDAPRVMKYAPAGLSIAQSNVQFMDANGEGRADLVVSDNDLAGYFPTNFNGEWDRRSFRKYQQKPSFNFADPEARLIDLNGDGVVDLLRTSRRLECYFNDPTEGWKEVLQVERKALAEFPNVNFSDPRVRLADMTGDSLQDIVLITQRNVEYWPYLGYGRWGSRLQMRNAPQLPPSYDPKRLLLGDIAGDGPHDLLYIDDRKVTIWINQNGNGFSEPIVIEGTPPVTDIDAVRLADLYGTGTSGILWSADQRENGRDHLFFLDLTGGLKPFVLNEMNNNLGAITRVQYRPSTFYYLEDEKSKATRWKCHLPIPVQVVARVEVIDEISRGKLTTEYLYHHGYWDGAEREFRGFGRVDQLDTETIADYHSQGLHQSFDFNEVEGIHYSPPTLTKTWFHQGPVEAERGDWKELDYSDEYWSGDPPVLNRPQGLINLLKSLPRRAQRDAIRTFRGSVLRTELYALDGSEREDLPYTVTETAYNLRPEFDPKNFIDGYTPKSHSGYIFFPLSTIQRTTQWERGDDPMTRFSFTESFDSYGIPRLQTSIACPRGWRKLSDRFGEDQPFLATYSKIQLAYSDSDTPYIKGKTRWASSYEIRHIGLQHLGEIKAAVRDPDRLALLSQTVTYYDGAAFEGLPFGQLGNYGIPVRTETLLITEEILREAWREENGHEASLPPYLNPNNPVTWPEEYPASFREKTSLLAGYTFYDGSEPIHARGYWVQTSRTKFDFQETGMPARGLPLAQKDPLGREAFIEYDDYHFLPLRSTDHLGLTTQAEYDYRIFQANLTIDPNDNVGMVGFSPLGFITETYAIGKEGVEEGDALDRNNLEATPSSRNEYDFFAFMEQGQPIWVKSIVREHHLYDADVPEATLNGTITSIQFSDGFGRTIQTRTQAEDILFGDPALGNELLPEDQHSPDSNTPQPGWVRQPDEPMNVVVSGWQIYDNKGRVVRQYEPFYSTGFAYADLSDSLIGQKVEQFYDSIGRVYRTLNPDGSEQQVVFGVPGSIAAPNLGNPDSFEPTPWEAYTYDANHNAGRTGHTSRVDEAHWNTPASMEVDPMGRTIRAVARNRDRLPNGDWSDIYEMITLSTYDIRGNLLTVTDPLGRIAFRYTYDLAFDKENGSRVWRIDSIDAGLRRIAFNALGQEIERRDSKGGLSLQAYDKGNRLTHFWARDKAELPVTLRQKLIFGDTLSHAGEGQVVGKEANLLGCLYQHHDEAGLVEAPAYDFKGNPIKNTRRVIRTEVLLNLAGEAAFRHFQVDWEKDNTEGLLEATVYTTSTIYDALNRPKQITYPEDIEGERKILIPTYNRAGALERIHLVGAGGIPPAGNQEAGVEKIAYNARGQRTLIAYTNGLLTRYTYDDQRFWLKRLRTERYDTTAAEHAVFAPSGGLLQDLGYDYDLTGNIIRIRDRSPGAGIPNTTLGQDAFDRDFTYDPIYRLLSATGREHSNRMPNAPEPWQQAMAHTNQDVTTTRFYTRRYQYDRAGNMLALQHITPNGQANFTRNFSPKLENNQLDHYEQSSIIQQLNYDPSGNMNSEGLSRRYYWNHADQLHVFRIQANDDSDPSLEARYLYDAGGQRVKKIVQRQGGTVTTTTYIGGVFEYHTETQAGELKENNTLHLMDGQSRIALVRVGQPFDELDDSPAVQYQLGDHLGNVHFVTDENGNTFSREEHYPYGGTSFGSFVKKRYRFTGMERDEESGLSYHSARYYVPWMAKWNSADPAGMMDGVNLYRYTKNNPGKFKDANGNNSSYASDNSNSPEWSRNPMVDQIITSYTDDELWHEITKIWAGVENLGGWDKYWESNIYSNSYQIINEAISRGVFTAWEIETMGMSLSGTGGYDNFYPILANEEDLAHPGNIIGWYSTFGGSYNIWDRDGNLVEHYLWEPGLEESFFSPIDIIGGLLVGGKLVGRLLTRKAAQEVVEEGTQMTIREIGEAQLKSVTAGTGKTQMIYRAQVSRGTLSTKHLPESATRMPTPGLAPGQPANVQIVTLVDDTIRVGATTVPGVMRPRNKLWHRILNLGADIQGYSERFW